MKTRKINHRQHYVPFKLIEKNKFYIGEPKTLWCNAVIYLNSNNILTVYENNEVKINYGFRPIPEDSFKKINKPIEFNYQIISDNTTIPPKTIHRIGTYWIRNKC